MSGMLYGRSFQKAEIRWASTNSGPHIYLTTGTLAKCKNSNYDSGNAALLTHMQVDLGHVKGLKMDGG
jgi:hypothetical protein